MNKHTAPKSEAPRNKLTLRKRRRSRPRSQGVLTKHGKQGAHGSNDMSVAPILSFEQLLPFVPNKTKRRIIAGTNHVLDCLSQNDYMKLGMSDMLISLLEKTAHYLFVKGKREEANELFNHVLELKYYDFVASPSGKYLRRVNFELTSVCNLKCKYCSFKSGLRKPYIDLRLFKKVLLDLCSFAPKLPMLALYMSGESLLHPQFVELLQIVAETRKQYPAFGQIVYLHTNGILWTPEAHHRIMETEALTRVIWSIDGVDRKTFEEMRPKADYNQILDNFSYFLAHRGEVEGWINNLRDKSCVGKEMDIRLLHLFLEADNAVVSPPKDLNQTGLSEIKYYGKTLGLCSYLFDTAIVTVDGQMSLCCVDYNSENGFGNLQKHTFREVFCGQERIKRMTLLQQGKREALPGCKTCELLNHAWLEQESTDTSAFGFDIELERIVRHSLAALYNQHRIRRIALFGAGKHSLWLEQRTGDGERPEIIAVLDEHPRKNVTIFDLKPILAADFDKNTVDAIILSSDCFQEQMRKRCRELYGHEIKLIDLYEGLPPGPYPKNLSAQIL